MEENQWPRKKKKTEKKADVIKKAKVLGKEHINHVGKFVPARKTGDDCRCSRYKCFEKIDEGKRSNILEDFNNMADKNSQDSHLTGLISVHLIQRKRPRVADEQARRDHAAAFSYKLRVEGRDVPICKSAFMSFHGVTKHRLTRIQNSLMMEGISPKDKRGSHMNRPNKTPDPILNLIEHHINSFKARQSHYSLRDNPNRKYLPEDLNVTDMHQAFLNEYHINISYKIYWTVFSNFNIHFGYPRSDTCTVCDSLNNKYKAEDELVRDQLQVQKSLHLKKAEAFLREKRKFIQQAKQGLINFISFDYMQNLPSNAVYYSRQLWYNVFGIHNSADDSVVIYRYLENEGRKGPSEVTSMILNYINDIPLENRTDDLVLLSDGCPGQNKNKIMVQFLYCIVHVLKVYKRVTYLFPIRGHSYLPNDQDFSLIGNKKRRTKNAEIPETWDSKILQARKMPNAFSLKAMKHYDFIDMKGATEPFFLRSPKPPLKLQQVRMIRIDAAVPCIMLRHSYFGSWNMHVICTRTPIGTTLELRPLYNSNPGIQAAKARDLLNLIQYLDNPQNKAFYEDICNAPKDSNQENNVMNIEIDDDDNSDGCENLA